MGSCCTLTSSESGGAFYFDKNLNAVKLLRHYDLTRRGWAMPFAPNIFSMITEKLINNVVCEHHSKDEASVSVKDNI